MWLEVVQSLPLNLISLSRNLHLPEYVQFIWSVYLCSCDNFGGIFPIYTPAVWELTVSHKPIFSSGSWLMIGASRRGQVDGGVSFLTIPHLFFDGVVSTNLARCLIVIDSCSLAVLWSLQKLKKHVCFQGCCWRSILHG
jgi:hypothetical protein